MSASTPCRPFENPYAGSTPFKNIILDHIMPRLSPNGWKILCVAIRQTWGWVDEDSPTGRKESDRISYSQFMDKSGIKSRPTAVKSVRECLDAGYLIRYQSGTHPKTGQPLFKYALNTHYELDNGLENEPYNGLENEPYNGLENEPYNGLETKLTKENSKTTINKEDAANAEPAPTPREKKPARQPTPAAVKVFREKTHRYPPKAWYEAVATVVGDNPQNLERWGQTCFAWVGQGWNPTNVSGMLECYQRREIPGKSNGKHNHTNAVDQTLAVAQRILAQEGDDGGIF